MSIPEGKTLAVLNVPYVYVEEDLCPLYQVSLDTLRIVTLLKKHGNAVTFINLRDTDTFSWKSRRAGLEGRTELPMLTNARPRKYMAARLLEMKPKPDEILIVCNLALAPYTFDLDMIAQIVKVCRKIHPQATLKLGGDFIDFFGEYVREGSIDHDGFIGFGDLDAFPPDFSVEKLWKYGLFQLTRGCNNRCSFCIAARQKPRALSLDDTLSYMKMFYKRHKPEIFWNWDPNCLLYPDHFADFLDAYAQSGMKAGLNFALGFQTDRLDGRIIDKLKATQVNLFTLPFESGSLKANRNIGKPYSIISSIQKLKLLEEKRANFNQVQSSYIIGYPHDDFRSIFRIQAAILNKKTLPLPFPLYVFPKTIEFSENREQLEKKSFSELHGQLWPLVKQSELDMYRNLLRFLLIGDLEKAKKNLHLLAPGLRSLFLEELALSEEFIALCESAEEDSPEELARIENTMQKRIGARKLLYIFVNPKPEERSTSRRMGRVFVERWQKENPEGEVTELDLYRDGLTFLTEDFLDFIYHRKTREELSDEARHLVDLTDRYVALLREADRIVLATPMYTLSIPAILKAFFEVVASRLFFEMGETLSPKPVCCILPRDGVYPELGRGRIDDPQINVQERLLLSAFDFIGIGREIEFLPVQGLHDASRREEILSEATERIRDVARRF